MTLAQSPASFSLPNLTSALGDNGLRLLGSFELGPADQWFVGRARQPRSIALVGNVGSLLWPYFDAARQARAGLTLDQWTEDVIGGIASGLGLDAVYPFKGPPYYPFIQWAKRTGQLFSSPIGLTIHPDYGLWIAFRAALLFDHSLGHEKTSADHPCESCEDRPCLSTCPVDAFDEEGYSFKTCLDHLTTPENACRNGGCLARIACPIGTNHRYGKPHAAFHMNQLLKAHDKL
jgi:ferredoxin-like protein FixX